MYIFIYIYIYTYTYNIWLTAECYGQRGDPPILDRVVLKRKRSERGVRRHGGSECLAAGLPRHKQLGYEQALVSL